MANVILRNTSLLLKAISKPNTGTYYCWAENEEGRGESDKIYLNIQCKTFDRFNHSFCAADESEEIVISPILATLMSSVGMLVILAVIIILVMKIKNEENIRELEKEKRKRSTHHSENKKLASSIDVVECRDISQVYLPDVQNETEISCCHEASNDSIVHRENVTHAQIVPSPQGFYDICISEQCVNSPALHQKSLHAQSKSTPILHDIEDIEEICKANERLVEEIYRCDQHSYSHSESYINS
ncbi:hypothetical protein B4U79_06196 [Dinothrombium tinctorium]|uniref:Uncharacterized protein n=1 Tax=Dinothrombium tinctorium TaxID=1965070 RepID=A0A3S3P6Z0_9ACAR|nr:hypothetical protein B4U79_09959 [Dinothrombium tinctorium]RWS13015.1 hypothetical protein B4U79_15840 [Dinothrombium tinctorium]RWS16220.1 hypothetical protein B4U79_06196 [Dinothrombium tinctorium]